MAQNESTRAMVIEMLTRRDELRPHEVTMLQAGLKHFKLYDGVLDGSFRDGTAAAAEKFFQLPENRHLLPLASDQVRNAVRTHSDHLREDTERNMTFAERYIPTWLGGPEKPKAADPYNDLFGNNPRPLENERRGMSLHTVMNQPNALHGEDIIALQEGLRIPGGDGLFGRTTSIQLARHLTAHPEDWSRIGVPLLNLAMSDSDNRNRMQDIPKPQEYHDRVRALINETRGLTGTNGATYELQVLLNAGGYYRNDRGERSFSLPDGGPGRDTNNAIAVYERENPRRRADAGGPGVEAETQLAQNGTGGVTPDKTPAVETAEVTRVAAAPSAPFKPPMG